jgi:RNA polymerase sigma-70 factor (ECF subfamily)
MEGSAVTDRPDNRAAVEKALCEGYARLAGYVRKFTADEQDADDLLHDFYVRALAKSRQLRDPVRVQGWLSAILRSVIADHFERRRRDAGVITETSNFEDLAASLTDGSPGDSVCECLDQILPGLPQKDADLIRRLDLRGEDRQEVAGELRLRLNTLNVRHFRIRQRLKGLLVDYCRGCRPQGFLRCECPSPAV